MKLDKLKGCSSEVPIGRATYHAHFSQDFNKNNILKNKCSYVHLLWNIKLHKLIFYNNNIYCRNNV
jgi:hypothetical protein